jgi:hypothetical protein
MVADGAAADAGSDAGPVSSGDGGERDASVPPADAGPDRPDAPSVDAGPDPSSCVTVHAGRSFCDGFESGDLSRWDGDRTPGASTVTVIDASAGPVYRGAHSLRAEAVMGSENASVQVAGFPSTMVSDYWLRAYFYFPSATMLACEIAGIGDIDGDHLVNAWVDASGVNIHAHGLVGDPSRTAAVAPDRDRWVCIEVHVAIDGAAGALEVYFDETLVVGRSGLDTSIVRPLEELDVGIAWKDESDPTQVLYVDEVVADTARIGCD